MSRNSALHFVLMRQLEEQSGYQLRMMTGYQGPRHQNTHYL